MGEHPGRLFLGHLKIDKHTSAQKRQQETKQILKKDSIYKQLHTDPHTQALKGCVGYIFASLFCNSKREHL